MRVGPLGCDAWESPHHYGATGTAPSEKARGCDRGQRCGCRMSILRASGAGGGLCQGNSTLHEGMQVKMASLPLPSPGKEKGGCWGRGHRQTGGCEGAGKEKCLAAGKSKATPGMRKAMSGRDTLIQVGTQTGRRWGCSGEGAPTPGERHCQGQGQRREGADPTETHPAGQEDERS